MRDSDLSALKTELLDAGVSPAYVRRAVEELRDHQRDLEAAALAAGLSPEQAADEAHARLGSRQLIAGAIIAQPELKTWPHRWPRAAHCLESAAAIAVLPAVPVVYCAYRGPAILRWSLAAALALIGTAAWLLLMQSAIPGP